jgi:hypothetical protein
MTGIDHEFFMLSQNHTNVTRVVEIKYFPEVRISKQLRHSVNNGLIKF